MFLPICLPLSYTHIHTENYRMRSVVSCYPLRIFLSKSFFASKKPEHFCFELCPVFMSFVFRSLNRFALFRSLLPLFCFLDHALFLTKTQCIFFDFRIALRYKWLCVVLFFDLCKPAVAGYLHLRDAARYFQF